MKHLRVAMASSSSSSLWGKDWSAWSGGHCRRNWHRERRRRCIAEEIEAKRRQNRAREPNLKGVPQPTNKEQVWHADKIFKFNTPWYSIV